MIKFLQKKRKNLLPPGQAGLSLCSKKCAFAYIQNLPKQPFLQNFAELEISNQHDFSLLREKITEFNLLGARTVLLLNEADYQVLLLEQPKVPASEKSEAIRWMIAEYIDFPVEEAVVDYMDLPQRANTSQPPMIYVIVSKREKIEAMVSSVNQAGLKVIAVDISQNALKQIALRLEDAKEGQALLYLSEDKYRLIIFKNRMLYMMRDLEMAQSLKDRVGKCSLKQQAYQELSLEIQKSLDYCASNLKNASVSRLVLIPTGVKKPHLLSSLSNLLEMPVREIRVSEFIDNAKNCSIATENNTILAIGAALRQFQ